MDKNISKIKVIIIVIFLLFSTKAFADDHIGDNVKRSEVKNEWLKCAKEILIRTKDKEVAAVYKNIQINGIEGG